MMGWIILAFTCLTMAPGAAAQQVRQAHRTQQIGVLGSDLEFEDIYGILETGNHIFVAEPNRISVVTRDGHLVRRMGSSGRGPGEFERIIDFGLLGDTLWVADALLRRLTLMTDEGKVLETIPVRDERLARRAYSLSHIVPVGGRLFLGVGKYRAAAIAAAVASHTPLVLLESDGTIHDTIALLDIREHDVGSVQFPGGDRGAFTFVPPIRDNPLWSVRTSTDRLAVVDRRLDAHGTGGAIITTYDLVGNLIWTRSFQGSAMPVPRSLGSDWIESVFETVPPIRETVGRGALEEALYLPEWFPPARALAMCADRSVWVSTGPKPREGLIEWLVFDQSGTLRHRVALPSGRLVLECTEEAAWVRARGEFGESFAERWELR